MGFRQACYSAVCAHSRMLFFVGMGFRQACYSAICAHRQILFFVEMGKKLHMLKRTRKFLVI